MKIALKLLSSRADTIQARIVAEDASIAYHRDEIEKAKTNLSQFYSERDELADAIAKLKGVT